MENADIEENLSRRLSDLARRTEAAESDHLNEALRRYLIEEETLVGELESAVKAADAGEFASKEEVQRVFNKYK